MAGLLIKELKIRGLVKRTLIVTPANLSFQWQREMKDKFRENFEIVRSDVLRANYGTNPWQEKNQVITSVSWVSRIEDAKESLLRTHWDLVIVDEAPIYGMMNWGDLFSARQALALTILAAKVRQVADHFKANPIGVAVQTLLGFALDRQADYNSSVCRWVPAGEFIGNTFGRQAIPMVWNFCEVGGR
jgi:superfamily II DNA or RNA helicase